MIYKDHSSRYYLKLKEHSILFAMDIKPKTRKGYYEILNNLFHIVKEECYVLDLSEAPFNLISEEHIIKDENQQWNSDRKYFFEMIRVDEFVKEYNNEYVAIYKSDVVGHNSDDIRLYKEMLTKIGNVRFYMNYVGEKEEVEEEHWGFEEI